MTATKASDMRRSEPRQGAREDRGGRRRVPRLRLARRAARDVQDRGIVSSSDRRRPHVRWSLGTAHTMMLLLLIVISIGPMLWLAKAAVSTTQDTLRSPLAFWPSGIDWANLSEAWNRAEVSRYFINTIWVATGSWAVQLLVATTGAYVLSVLRPRFTKVINAAVLATLFIPGIVVLVPLYLTVLSVPPFDVSLLNTYWAVWLPAGANAFNLLLVKRFMDNLPRDVIEAAQVDGAGPFRLLFAIVIPMCRPILGVVSIFAVLVAWKDFLWPKLVLADPTIQPISVRLETIRATVPLEVLLASMVIAMLLPIAVFLLFQRLFLRNVGLGGAIKG